MKKAYSEQEIPAVARELISLLKKYHILTFTGPLGAGKTTLIKETMHQLGVLPDDVTSPTFTYLNIYKTKDGESVYHFDLYRIRTEQDFINAGFAEYLDQPESMVIIEWPEVIEDLLRHHKICAVNIDYDARDVERRVMTLACN